MNTPRKSSHPYRPSPWKTTRNRAEFPVGREQVRQFLERKWARELDYRLIKELRAFGANRIAVRFAYECHDDSGQWFRSYGNENWEFNPQGLMQRRFASINDLPIRQAYRSIHWPLGRRPGEHPGLSQLDLQASHRIGAERPSIAWHGNCLHQSHARRCPVLAGAT